MNEHTPGPWNVSRDAVPAGHVQITVYAEETGERVATAFEREGNARLIAAAPDLLAALGALANWIDIDPDAYLGDDDGSLQRAMSAARAAIARVQS